MCAPDSTTRKASLARKTAHLGHLIHRYYQVDAREKGMGPDPLRGQGRVLALLAAKPDTTQRELSYLLDMRQQSLSELLAKLEEKGYITRSKSAEDGRVVKVVLTDEGAAAAPNLNALNERPDVLDCLDADERAQFETLVDKVTASIEGKLEEKGVDPHAMKRGPHRGPKGCGPKGPMPEGFVPGPCGPKGFDPRFEGPHGPHMMKRGPHFEGAPEGFDPRFPQGPKGPHCMRQA